MSATPRGRPAALRRLRASETARRAAAWLLAQYVRLVFRGTRWTWVGREHLDACIAGGAFIGAVWHSRLLPIAMLRPPGRRAVALISANADGDFVARIIGNLGAEAVRGSSRDPRKADKEKGGASAAPKLVEALETGAIVVITPDGPRGPRMRAKPGVAAIAAAARVPVLPVAYATRRARVFRSWDRFVLPWPFTRGAFVFGAPIAPADPGDPAALEAVRAAIEAAITDATRRADALVGRETPEPGPAPSALGEEAAA